MTTMKVLLFTLLFLLHSCKKNDAVDIPKSKIIHKKSIDEKVVFEPKAIGDYASDDADFFWNAKQSDSAKYWIRIVFQKDFAVYQFHGQCLYWFFTDNASPKSKKIELLWSYKVDCISDMNFIHESNGVKKYPKAGDYFSSYTLINDSVIKANYNFPEWVKAVNKRAKDSIFPTYLYLNKNK